VLPLLLLLLTHSGSLPCPQLLRLQLLSWQA
jgi:hypothetical protein